MTPEIAYSGINKARARDFYIAAEIKFNQKKFAIPGRPWWNV